MLNYVKWGTFNLEYLWDGWIDQAETTSSHRPKTHICQYGQGRFLYPAVSEQHWEQSSSLNVICLNDLGIYNV